MIKLSDFPLQQRDVNMPALHVYDINPERVGGLFRHEEVIVPRTGKKYLRLTTGSGGATCVNSKGPLGRVCKFGQIYGCTP